MTQFGENFQVVIKNDLPNFVLAFYHRVVAHLNQEDYSSILHFDMKEIVERKESLGEAYDKYVVPFVLTILANVRFDNEKYEDAMKTLERVLVLQEKMLGKKHPTRGATLNNLAVVYAKEGKHEKVKMLAERALDIYDQSTCHDYPFVPEKLRKLARYFNNQGKFKEEERCYVRALKICEAKQSSDDSLIAAASNELAQCYLRRGKLKDAEEHFKKALSRACAEKEFGGAGDKYSWLKKLTPKKKFEIAKDDNKSFINIWKEAEEREKNKRKVSEEVSPPVWNRPATFYAPTFEFALKGLEAVYEKQGKHVAAKTLNHYANQQLVKVPHIPTEDSAESEVPPQLPPKRRDVIQASSGIPSPLPSSPPSLTPPVGENGPDRWSVCQIEITELPPPPPLPTRGSGPGPIVSRENIPTMRSPPSPPLPSTQQLSPARESESSCETISQGFMVLPSAPLPEEGEPVIGTETVQEQTRFLERIVAELQAEIAEKARRLAEAERTIETHGAFCCICLDEVANRMWSGCNHLVACGECAERLLREEENRSDGGIACPKCRTHGHVLPAFI